MKFQRDFLGSMLVRYAPYLLLLGLLAFNIKMVGATLRAVVPTAMAMVARYEMWGIRSALVAHYSATTSFPRPGRDFEKFVRDTMSKGSIRDATKDRFGMKYAYAVLTASSGRECGFRIVSAGPDRWFLTRDDIVVEWQSKIP